MLIGACDRLPRKRTVGAGTLPAPTLLADPVRQRQAMVETVTAPLAARIDEEGLLAPGPASPAPPCAISLYSPFADAESHHPAGLVMTPTSSLSVSGSWLRRRWLFHKRLT